MKKVFYSFLAAACLLLSPSEGSAESSKVGVVRFKNCVEESKVGKKEQEFFERLKQDMQNTLQAKEKALQELAQKFQDPDYLDSLAPEAEAELKHKFRSLSQDFSQYQNEFYQQLQFANVRIIQNISDVVREASKRVATKLGLTVIENEENTFFFDPSLDVTKEVIATMDQIFEEDTKQNNS